jgi:hypothetical protein
MKVGDMIKMRNRRELRKGDAWGIILEIGELCLLGATTGEPVHKLKIAWQGGQNNIGTMRTDILEIVK